MGVDSVQILRGHSRAYIITFEVASQHGLKLKDRDSKRHVQSDSLGSGNHEEHGSFLVDTNEHYDRKVSSVKVEFASSDVFYYVATETRCFSRSENTVGSSRERARLILGFSFLFFRRFSIKGLKSGGSLQKLRKPHFSGKMTSRAKGLMGPYLEIHQS